MLRNPLAGLNPRLIIPPIAFCLVVFTLVDTFYLTTPYLPLASLYSPDYLSVPRNFTYVEQENLQLSRAECVATYPKLYKEADRARKYYKKGISLADVDAAEKENAAARLVILNNKLYVKNFYGGVNTRAQAAIASVYRALITSPEGLPDVDFVIQINDAGDGNLPVFCLDRKESQPGLWLMPDFGFFAWPEPMGAGLGSYDEIRASTLEREMILADLGSNETTLAAELHQPSSFAAKSSDLFWRGVPMVPIREALFKGSEGQDWSNVKDVNWGNLGEGKYATIADHCEHKYLAHVEGWAYSGRLKFIQNCRSVIITHPLQYIQHYHHLFNTDPRSPLQNMVEVPLPLEDNLPGVMESLLKDEARSELIASNSWREFREGYISPSANACYFRYALAAYASVQKFKPTRDKAVSYDSFLLMGTVHWDPY